MILANGAREMDMSVEVYCAFWGLLLIRKPGTVSSQNKDWYEKMFAAMTASGAEQLPLSRMNMGGAGKEMLKAMMENQDAASLEEFLKGAFHKGVRFYACRLSMQIMGFDPEELLPDVEVSDVKGYLKTARQAGIQLFI